MKSQKHPLLIAALLAVAPALTFAQVTPEEHAAHHPAEQAAPAQKSPQPATAAPKSAWYAGEHAGLFLTAMDDQDLRRSGFRL